jgi:uncharacterized protein YdeI (YjbR/CyaY-like superfamily)
MPPEAPAEIGRHLSPKINRILPSIVQNMEGKMNPLDFIDRNAWRSWLDEHHATSLEAWLIIQKKHSQHVGLSLGDAVEEALCYGWIDGTLQKLDDQRYLLRFSPRRANSVWSIRNIQRVEELLEAGKMTQAGLTAIHEGKMSGQWKAALDREKTDQIPAELQAALRRRKGALAAYRSLPDSHKKRYVYWIQSAKRDETKRKRIEKIVREVLEGLRT